MMIKGESDMKFSVLYGSAFIRPVQVFRELASNDRKLRLALKAFMVAVIGYTMVYAFLIAGGGEPWKPWLAIPHHIYYRWNVFMLAPSMFGGWILSAGVAQVFSRMLGGKGSFEDMLTVFGFGIGIASWATLVHDWTTSFLGALHIIDQHHYEYLLNTPTIWRDILWFTMIAYLVWFVVIFTKGVSTVQGIKRGPAAFIGAFSFLVYQLFFFIFNR